MFSAFEDMMITIVAFVLPNPSIKWRKARKSCAGKSDIAVTMK